MFGIRALDPFRPRQRRSWNMRLLQIVTAVSVVLSATAAQGQSAATGAPSCDLPHGSGVSSQQLVFESSAPIPEISEMMAEMQ